jgi:hypothetical protein
MPTLIPLAQVNMTSESEQRYPIRPNPSALYPPPKKILARSKEDNITDISPYDHNMPPLPLQLSVDMIIHAKTAIDGITSKYNKQDHLTKKNEGNNDDESSEVDDDDWDGDYIQMESSDDDDNLRLAAGKPVLPTSLFYFSDNEFDHLLDDEEVDEDAKKIEYTDSRKRETIGRCKGTLLKGGPQEPSYEGMMAGEEKAAREEYQNKRKKWRDQTRSERLWANKTTSFNDDDFTGNMSPTLRTMSDVCAAHLKRGDLFPDRDLVLLRVSKEANFRGIHYTVKKGDNRQLYCTGPGFLIYASHLVRKGWLVTRCEICDTESAIDTQPNTHQHDSCSPFWMNMIIPLIATTIAKTLMVSNKVLRKILEPYGKAYCFTDNIFAKLTNQSTQAYLWSTSGKCWLHIIPQGQVGEVGPFCVTLFYKPKRNHKEYQKGYYC